MEGRTGAMIEYRDVEEDVVLQEVEGILEDRYR